MTSLGYTVIGTDADIMFERGNAIGRIPGSPPRTWPVRVFAHIGKGRNGSEIILRWELRSRGKLLSVWDVKYFRLEVEGAVKSCAARHVNMNELEMRHTSTALLTLFLYLAIFLTVTVMFVLMTTGDISMVVWLCTLFALGCLLLAVRAPLFPATKRQST